LDVERPARSSGTAAHTLLRQGKHASEICAIGVHEPNLFSVNFVVVLISKHPQQQVRSLPTALLKQGQRMHKQGMVEV
jgi:hypothetical protein